MKFSLQCLLLFAPFSLGFSQVTAQTPAAYFTVSTAGAQDRSSEQFVIKLTDPSLIQHARTILNAPTPEGGHVMGTVVKARAYYNSPWSFHVDPASVSFFDVSVEVCDASTSYVEDHLSQVGEAFLPDSVWCPWTSKLVAEIPEPAGAASTVRLASAASNSEAAVSPGALISIYGQNLTNRTAQAESSEPVTTLAGVTVEMTVNGAIISRKLPLIFASPNQVNALIPADLEPGSALVALMNDTGGSFECFSYLEPIAPALFSVPSNNIQYAAATLLRVHADGSRSYESLVSVDPQSGALLPAPLAMGAQTDDLYLSLYGTGFGHSTAQSASLTLASETIPIQFVGPQGEIDGLDQVNIPIPHSLSDQPFVDAGIFAKNPQGYPVRTNVVRILIKSN